MLAAGCGDGHGDRAAPPEPQRGDDYVGIYSDDVYFGDAAYKLRTLARQREAGIELIRQPFHSNEFEAQPERFDEFVRETGRAGMRVLPVLVGKADEGGMRAPDPRAFARYAAELVRRYGPGTRHPIRAWQVWNEPNIPSWWSPRPDPAKYGELLRAASQAIREADPGAEIVAAGLPDSRLGEPGPAFLKAALKTAGDDAVDTIAVHPYARTPADVVEKVRAIQRVAPGKRVWVTEVGWGTGGRRGDQTVDEKTQARYLRETFAALRELDVRGVVWFQWRDPKPFPGRRPIWPYYAGLTDVNGDPKPALAELRRLSNSAR